MLLFSKCFWSLVLLYSLFGSRCLVQVNPEVVKRGKEATSLVEVVSRIGGFTDRAFGSAFCIDPSGLFVTNAHVVQAVDGVPQIFIVLNSGEKSQRRVSARVLALNKGSDLALLQISTEAKLTALELGESEGLLETSEVVVFGFPLGDALATGANRYPSVTINTGRISALRKQRGELESIQLDAAIHEGNSGGPVLNSKGQVIGVINAGFEDTARINFAIPVNTLKGFLSKSTITITPSSLTLDQATKEQEFSLILFAFSGQSKRDIEIIFQPETPQSRTFIGRTQDGKNYLFRATPLLVIPKKRLQLTIGDGEDRLQCVVEDREVTLGKRKVRLSEIQRIVYNGKPEVLLMDGTTVTDEVTGLEHVATKVAGVNTELNLNRPQRLLVQEGRDNEAGIPYRVVIRRDGKIVDTISGRLSLESTFVKPGIASLELLIANYDAGSLKRFNGHTGTFVDDLAFGNGIINPVAFTFGPDGSLYISGNQSHTVHRFSSTGQFIDVFVKRESGEPHDAFGVAFGPDGNLYLSSVYSHKIRRYNGKTGLYIDDFVPRERGGLNLPGQLRFGPDGNLYVTCTKMHIIKRYNGKTGAFIDDFAGLNGINELWDFVFGPDGKLYVGSYQSHEVKRFDAKTGRFLDTFINKGSGGLLSPTGMAFGPDGNFYVASRANVVKRYDAKTGAFLGDFSQGGAMNYPAMIMFRPRVNSKDR